MRNPVALALAGLVTLLFSSCQAAPKGGPDTAAIVNQTEIKNAEVEKVYQTRLKQAAQTPSAEEAATLRLNILSQMVNDEMLMQRAASDKLVASDDEVNVKFTEFKKDYTEEKFQQFLKDQGVSADDIKKELRKSATIEKLYNKEITSKISVSESEIKEYFARNKANYNLPESWHVLHLLVTPFADSQVTNARNDDAKTDEVARQKVVGLLKRILSGEDFAIVARDYSEDSSSAQAGGDLRLLSLQQLEAIDPRFRQAVQSLKVGETFASPVPTKYGYHLVKLIEKEAGGQHELTDPKVQADTRQAIFNRKETLLKTAYLEAVRSQAIVKNLLAQKILSDAAGSGVSK
ncbi:MAG TPA: peptidylprolyl isomerase [Terriglobia bacterium]|nr:peptidylprolyl isomerase [Terriglobia bacterium]